MMLTKNRTLWLLLLTVVLAAAVLRRKSPPYELGVHTAVVQAESVGTTGGPLTGSHLGACSIFPSDNIWNTRIDKLPRDRRSDDYVSSTGPMKRIHPDFGVDLRSGIPFSEIPSGTRALHVEFENKDESDPGTYPIPHQAPVEGGSDQHLILIDPQRCLLYELYAISPKGDRDWTASSGLKMDLTDNVLRPLGKTSADAAGLPIFPGLIRYDEVQQGEIRHALRFTLPRSQKAFVWPGRHHASALTDPSLVPMGMRFRLRADFDISKYSKTNQVIMTALKRYGMFMADNGSAMFISGVSDKRWNDDDLHRLGDMKAEDFEAVDESGLQLLPDSGRVDPVELQHFQQ
jgi:hypothetical protein